MSTDLASAKPGGGGVYTIPARSRDNISYAGKRVRCRGKRYEVSPTSDRPCGIQ